MNEAPLLQSKCFRPGLAALLLATGSVVAQQTASTTPNESAELTKMLSNPVAALSSGAFQNNCEFGGGPEWGIRFTVTVLFLK